MAPDSTVAGLFGVMRPYMPSPPPNPPPSPFEWGREERIRQLFGGKFDLNFEKGSTVLRMPNGEEVWRVFVTGYGPTKSLATSLDDTRREDLKRDFIAFHERKKTDLGVAVPREYLVTIGQKRHS